jgi:hypothetical protein
VSGLEHFDVCQKFKLRSPIVTPTTQAHNIIIVFEYLVIFGVNVFKITYNISSCKLSMHLMKSNSIVYVEEEKHFTIRADQKIISIRDNLYTAFNKK